MSNQASINIGTDAKPVALITGAARRVGAAIAQYLHQQGMRVVIHYHQSKEAAEQLVTALNAKRLNSAVCFSADLTQTKQLLPLVQQAANVWGRLDILINSASRFYPTPLETISETEWSDLMDANLKAPLFLSHAALPYLKQTQGCIINITDIHAIKPVKDYSLYCMTKAGLWMMTQALARDLGPEVRVNAVAPGVVMWPEGINTMDEEKKQQIVARTALKRPGSAEDIAKAVWFLIHDAPYVTGETISVDGGRHLFN